MVVGWTKKVFWFCWNFAQFILLSSVQPSSIQPRGSRRVAYTFFSGRRDTIWLFWVKSRVVSAYLDLIFVSKKVSRLVNFLDRFACLSCLENIVSKFFKIYMDFCITIQFKPFQAFVCLWGTMQYHWYQDISLQPYCNPYSPFFVCRYQGKTKNHF